MGGGGSKRNPDADVIITRPINFFKSNDNTGVSWYGYDGSAKFKFVGANLGASTVTFNVRKNKVDSAGDHQHGRLIPVTLNLVDSWIYDPDPKFKFQYRPKFYGNKAMIALRNQPSFATDTAATESNRTVNWVVDKPDLTFTIRCEANKDFNKFLDRLRGFAQDSINCRTVTDLAKGKDFDNPFRRLASSPVGALPNHQLALPGSDSPILPGFLLLSFFLLVGFLAFRCLRRFRAKPRRDSFGFLPDHLRESPLNQAERMV